VDILEQWQSQWNDYVAEGYVMLPEDSGDSDSKIRLSADGMLRVDGLLSAFFEPQFRNVRYT
jgi:oxygen-independent coproporphyrinogen-3 oxidase